MRIAITGAGGFIGRRLFAEIQGRDAIGGKAIDELIIVDRVLPEVASAGKFPIRRIVGDVNDPAVRASLFQNRLGGLFHLAATLTAEAERNFDGGVAANLFGFIDLLEECRRHGDVRMVFSSSMASFGGPLPMVVPDDVRQRPQSSYGTQKAIAELLLDDYTRRDFMDARGLRLPVVLLRGRDSAPALSEYISAIVREPLLGARVVSPFPPKTQLPIVSVGTVARAMCLLFDLPSAAFGAVRTMNLPALTVTIEDMVDALVRRVGPAVRELIEWRPDPELIGLIDAMPKGFTSARAIELGIKPEPTFDAVLDDFISAKN